MGNLFSFNLLITKILLVFVQSSRDESFGITRWFKISTSYNNTKKSLVATKGDDTQEWDNLSVNPVFTNNIPLQIHSSSLLISKVDGINFNLTGPFITKPYLDKSLNDSASGFQSINPTQRFALGQNTVRSIVEVIFHNVTQKEFSSNLVLKHGATVTYTLKQLLMELLLFWNRTVSSFFSDDTARIDREMTLVKY